MARTMPTGHPAHTLPEGLHSLFSVHSPTPCCSLRPLESPPCQDWTAQCLCYLGLLCKHPPQGEKVLPPPITGAPSKSQEPSAWGARGHSRDMTTGSRSCVSLGKLPSLSGTLSSDRAGQSTLPGPLGSGQLRLTAGGKKHPLPDQCPLPPLAEASAIPQTYATRPSRWPLALASLLICNILASHGGRRSQT